MWKPISLAVGLLVTAPVGVPLYPQSPSQPVPDHPSNGVLELTLSPIFRPKPGPPPKGSDERDNDVWRGDIKATLKNVSQLRVHLVEGGWPESYGIEVLDSSGDPVALTENGERALKPRGPRVLVGPVFMIDLWPLEETTARMNLQSIWQITPGQAYTIKVKRTLRPAEEVDISGAPLRGELSATLKIEASAKANAK